MATPSERWWRRPQLWVEAFAVVNFGVLTLDIYLAHSVNQFRNPAEYVPLFFSAAAGLVLALGLMVHARWPAVWKDLGYLVGWIAVLVGLAGVIFHLESRFFDEHTLRSLTYSAPFAAPLAYTGLGLLLIMNRMVAPDTVEWAQWVFLLALGGFVGNFIFSLTDHAENNFFNPVEWVPVVASAVAIGFMAVPLLMTVTRRYLELCAVILLLEGAVGVLGFLLHGAAILRGPSTHLFENIIQGAPPMAPLLFANLALLGFIALPQLRASAPDSRPESMDLKPEPGAPA
jgi:hypothetical protein